MVKDCYIWPMTGTQYSARAFQKYLKIARTFADMEGSEKIRKKDIAAALMARDMERERATMAVL